MVGCAHRSTVSGRANCISGKSSSGDPDTSKNSSSYCSTSRHSFSGTCCTPKICPDISARIRASKFRGSDDAAIKRRRTDSVRCSQCEEVIRISGWIDQSVLHALAVAVSVTLLAAILIFRATTRLTARSSSCLQSQRVGIAERVITNVDVNTSPRRAPVVAQGNCPRRDRRLQ